MPSLLLSRPKPPFPPGPSISPYRQLRTLVEDPMALYLGAAAECGPVFTLNVLGQEPWVIVAEPALLREIFRATADEYHGDADALKFLVGNKVVLFLDGDEHRRERRVLNQPFKHVNMLRYAESMGRNAGRVLDATPSCEPVPALELFADIGLRTIVESIFGVSDPERLETLTTLFRIHIHGSQQGFIAAIAMVVGGVRVRNVLDGCARLVDSMRDSSAPLPSPSMLRYFAARAGVSRVLREELASIRQNDDGRVDVFSLLAKARYDDGTSLSDESLLDELFALVVGGHETSSITMAWALYFLARNPELLARAQDEVDAVFGDEPITAERSEALSYVVAVLEETMRMRPVAAAIPRRIQEGVKLGDFELPPGTRTFPSPLVLHFREDLWPEPTVFRPERFLGDQKPSPFHYMPFGGGSRACVGRPFAMMQMKIVLSEVLRRFEPRLVNEAEPKQILLGLMSGPADGVPVTFTPRKARTATLAAE